RRIWARDVDEVDQHPAALDVTEEAIANPGAFGRAFDQAGDVGQHELSLAVTDHAKLGHQGCESVVPDLRSSVRDLVDERRLARIGQADETRVREQLKA